MINTIQNPIHIDQEKALGANLSNILGEVLWHSVTVDPGIEAMSRFHKDKIKEYADSFLTKPKDRPIRFLEVASYAHFSGYLLEQEYGWEVTLSDISSQTLKLGKRISDQHGVNSPATRRVALDFHELPFASGSFDVVYIASALHHTLEWKTVLAELQRVTATGGILILQNEPCKREFCFNKFPTNRQHSFRAVEAELYNAGLIRTVAEAYFGSRPESLFGMIENQNMSLVEILDSLTTTGTVKFLHLQEAECISTFENSILSAPRDPVSLTKFIESELNLRLSAARNALDQTDSALGYSLPSTSEISQMATKIAVKICCLPDQASPMYQIELAEIFGAALTTVVQKHNNRNDKAQTAFISKIEDGIEIGYPRHVARLLDQSDDLLPDIQIASEEQLTACFNQEQWDFRTNSEIKSFVMKHASGAITLQKNVLRPGRILILIRFYVHPDNAPYRVSLFANQIQLATQVTYQPESFLLKGEASVDGEVHLSIRGEFVHQEELRPKPPVTICAIRAVWLPN